MRVSPLWALPFAVSCAGERSTEPSHGTSFAPLRDAASEQVVRGLEVHRAFRDRIGAGADVRLDARGFTLVHARPKPWQRVGEVPLSVVVPRDPHAALRLARRDSQGAWIEITSDVASSERTALVDNALVTRFPTYDVLRVLETGSVEEIRVLRSTAAASSARYRIALGPGIAATRLVAGRLEVVDGQGRVRFEVPPPFALDAKGHKLPVVTKLEGETLTVSVDTAGAEYPIALDPVWTTTTGSMVQPRRWHAATRLGDGKVLLTSGNDYFAQKNAERFDPTAGTFQAVPDMLDGQWFGSLVTLDSGKALLASGYSGSGPTTTQAQLFDPATSAFVATGSGAIGGNGHVAKVSGGAVCVNAGSSAKYDATTGTWSAAKSAPIVQSIGGTTDGRAVAMGGGYAYVYDPATDGWSAGVPLGGGRFQDRLATITAVDTSRVLVVGGFSQAYVVDDANVFDAATRTWTSAPPVPFARTAHAAAALGGGRVLVTGGQDQIPDLLDSAEVWTASTNSWSAAGSMNVARGWHTATPLLDGRVLVAGGGTEGGVIAFSSAEIWSALANGQPCKSAGECGSGFCADGVCCNAACGGTCEACDVSGKVGTCSGRTGAPKTGSCAPYAACSAGSCATTCGGDADCTSTAYCSAGKCVPKNDVGTKCSAARECASGACVDGYCCNTSCSGTCEACDATGKEGTCVAVKGKPHGARPTCSGDATCGNVCDGADRTACHVASATTPCGKDACESGTGTRASYCNGAGACADVPVACSPYACGSTACKTSCSAATDCAAGHYCKGAVCVPVEGLGKACTGSDGCASGTTCVDGICCAVAGCPAGRACVVSGSTTVCLGKLGTACSSAAECGSGNCVDGVCCDTACDGVCAACDLPGSKGTCMAVVGAPHGARACPSATEVCAQRTCNGVDVGSCGAFVGPEKICREATCEAGIATAAARCDGTGSCPTATPGSCDGFACDSVSHGCRTTCSGDADCLSGFRCLSGKCNKPTSTCTPDGLAVVGADGVQKSCAPFACRDDVCLGSCKATADCGPGFVCDVGAGTCTPLPAAANDDEGGCSYGHAKGGGLAWAMLLLGGVLLGRRRALLAALSLAGCSRSAPAPSLDVAERAFPELSRAHALQVEGARHVGLAAGVRLEVFDDRHSVSLADAPSISVTFTTTSHPRVATRALLLRGDERFAILEHGVEQLTVMRSRQLGMRVTLGEGVLRIIDKRLVLFDRAGVARLGSSPIVARDAEGHDVDVHVALAGDELVLALPEGARLPVVVDPAWTALTAAMSTPREQPAATRLADGRVLVAAGWSGSAETSSAEIFDPVTRTFSLTGSLAKARSRASAVTLGSGKVLLVGYNDADTELYDPASGTWSTGPKFPAAIFEDLITTTSSGDVLAGSGYWGGPLPVYRLPNGGSSWETTPMPATYHFAGPTLIGGFPGGGALLAGNNATDGSTAELWDPTGKTWVPVPAMSLPRATHSSTVLADGRVLLAGGYTVTFSTPLSTAEIFDPVSKTWSATGSLSAKRYLHKSHLLPDGRVLAIGGYIGLPTSTAEIWSPSTGTWSKTGSLSQPRHAFGSVPLTDGRVVVIGGTNGTGRLSTAEIFAPGITGSSCTYGNECASGNCVDGTCCAQASCGLGGACNVAGHLGTCIKKNGVACASAGDCQSGSCVDGVCCDGACAGQCEACNVLGKEGTCSPVLGGTRGSRPPCSDGGGDPCKAMRCDGVSRTTCALHPAGAMACSKNACTAGVETRASTCDGAGKCADVPKSCGTFACGATACKTSCSGAGDCAPGHYCKSGACVKVEGLGTSCTSADSCAAGLFCTDGVCCASASCEAGSTCGTAGVCAKKRGAVCGSDVECGSGFCTDGVCCDARCDGQCEACDGKELAGTCSPVLGAPHGARAACPAKDGDACAAQRCDGLDRKTCAAKASSEVECRVASCGSGAAVASARCDGSGACPAPVTTSCGGFGCDGTTCKTTCSTVADCRDGYDCVTGRCEPKAALCTDDGAGVKLPDGSVQRCYPALCRAGRCIEACSTSSDCASGFLCDTGGKTCVAPSATGDEGGGCSVGSASSGSSVLYGLVLLALARRRRDRLRSWR